MRNCSVGGITLKRKIKLETADALKKMDSRTVIEWVDREEGYAPTKTKQLTLGGTPAAPQAIEAQRKRLEQKSVKDYALPIAIAGGIAAAFSLIGLALSTQPERTAYPASGEEMAHPMDRLPYGIRFEGVEEIRIADTNSMLPVFDAGHAALGIPIPDPKDLQAGDIITFYDQVNDLVIHRIIEIGNDEEGWYAVTQGDNNDYPDKPIRAEQLDKVVVGVLY